MLLIDNAIEQMAKTYLSLPKRITGIKIPRKRLQEIFDSFPALLDALEEYVDERLDGIDLGSIEWYHRLRNELYHQGMGLTVERDKVEIYAELASTLFQKLFEEDLDIPLNPKVKLLGQFIESWNKLESILSEYAIKAAKAKGIRRTKFSNPAKFLCDEGMLSTSEFDELAFFRGMTNAALHNETDYKEVITPRLLTTLQIMFGSVLTSLHKSEKGVGKV